MNWLIIRRCLLVSFLLGAIAPFFSMNLAAPVEIQASADELAKITKNELIPLTEKEFKENVEPYLWENTNHFDRLLSAVFYPSFWLMYLNAFIAWVIGFLVATHLVSYLNTRKV